MDTIINIAIDGPAGAGKSTIAKMIAKRLDIIYVDTGAMYRAFGYYCFINEINPDDEGAIINCLEDIDVSIVYQEGAQQVLLNNENVTDNIRSQKMGKYASSVSKHKGVRIKLVDLQRQLAKKVSLVMDGRDIGTVVLPDATLKIYLTASVEERAKRRWLELERKGIKEELAHIEDEISERDFQDMNRKESPLKKADDAVKVDTSNLSIDKVVEYILALYQETKED